MYKYKKEPFGNWESVTLFNENTGNGFSFVPDLGATMLELNFKNRNVIDGYNTPEELAEGAWGKSAVLFPFPNRLKDGKYILDGNTYSFPINDGAGNNAIHGLGRDKVFEVKDIETGETQASVKCVYHNNGNNTAYPFPFSVEISFSINDDNEFDMEMLFINQSAHAIPVGLGWHPYFILDEKVDNCQLQLPECQMIKVNEEMIPTGEKKNYIEFASKNKIEDTVLDTCFEIKNQTGKTSIILEGAYGNLEYWQEAGERLWNFFQIFTPPARNCIAIEPMTCNIDAFNNKEGLVMLESGNRMGGKFGVVFSEIKMIV